MAHTIRYLTMDTVELTASFTIVQPPGFDEAQMLKSFKYAS